MTQLTIMNPALTMTSQEIADMVGKRHDNVKRTIESLINQGVIESPQIEEIPTATRPVAVYVFVGERGKRDSIVVVAQLSPEFTARLVDRWQELEAKQPATDPIQVLNDPAAMRSLLLTYSETVLQLQAAQAEMAPKVKAFERLALPSDGSFCLRESAKLLQRPEKMFIQFLHAKNWIYKHPMGRSWMAYSPVQQKGYMEHKLTEGDKADGTRWQSVQVRVTAKGLAKLALMMEKSGNDQIEVAA